MVRFGRSVDNMHRPAFEGASEGMKTCEFRFLVTGARVQQLSPFPVWIRAVLTVRFVMAPDVWGPSMLLAANPSRGRYRRWAISALYSVSGWYMRRNAGGRGDVLAATRQAKASRAPSAVLSSAPRYEGRLEVLALF